MNGAKMMSDTRSSTLHSSPVPGFDLVRAGHPVLGTILLVVFCFGLSGLVCAALSFGDAPPKVLGTMPLSGTASSALVSAFPGFVPGGSTGGVTLSVEIGTDSISVEKTDPIIPNLVVTRQFVVDFIFCLAAIVGSVFLSIAGRRYLIPREETP